MESILFLVNDRWSLKPGGTNATLIKACAELGYKVLVTDVVHLQASSNSRVFAECLEVPSLEKVKTASSLQKKLSKAKNQLIDLADVTACWIRTSPGKDVARSWAHRLALEAMRLACEKGTCVINDPTGLQKASSKFYTVRLPEKYVPETLICHTLQSVEDFAQKLNGPLVIKPLLGSQGRDVFFFESPESLNTRQVVDILGRTGYLVVQEYLPAATDGDIRVLTVGEKILEANGPVGIRRIPASGEMRSNISLGGTAEIVKLDKQQVKICERIAKHLHADGIVFSGLDLIGDKVVEVNVFSPSGLQEFQETFDSEIAVDLVQRLLKGKVKSRKT